MTNQNLAPHRLPRLRLQDGFDATTVAACTDVVLGLSVAHCLLYSVGNNARHNFLKLIALLLCIPYFKLGNLRFETAYVIYERHLRRLGFQNLSLERERNLVTSGSVVNILKASRSIHHRLEDGNSRYSFPDHDTPGLFGASYRFYQALPTRLSFSASD